MAKKPQKYQPYSLEDFANDDLAGSIANYASQPEAPKEAPPPEKGLMTSLASEAWQGVKSAGRSVLATGNTVAGDLTDVELLSKAQQADRANDAKAKTELMAEIDRRKKANPEAGWTDAVKDVASAAWDNPRGTAELVASQLPNSAVALGGGWAGAKAGAVAGAALGSAVPVVGTAVGGVAGGILGGLTGMFLGNFALETGGKAMDKAGDGFTQQEASDTLVEGAKKAGVITGVDALTFGAGKLVSRAFMTPAVKAGARAEAKVLADAGIDITNGAKIAEALTNSELRTAAKAAGETASKAAATATRRAGNAASGLTMETAGEGVGEYYGEEAATGKGDVYDAALEAVSSFSQSAVQTAQAMRESGSNALDQKEILKAALAQSGGVLSRAAATSPALAADPFTTRANEVESAVRDGGLLQKLRDVGPQHVNDFLAAFQVAKDTAAPASARQAAIQTLDLGVQWATDGQTGDVQGTGSPYSDALVPAEAIDPATGASGPAMGTLAALGLSDDVDVDAPDVSNRLGAPPAPQLTNNPSPSLQGLFSDGAPNPTAPSDPSGLSVTGNNAATGLGAGLGADSGQASGTLRPDTADLGAPAGLASRAPDAPVTPAPIAGDQINQTWTAFHPESGTLAIPRKQMPQIKSEHRGAMVTFLKARGIGASSEVVPADSLKPTQDKFSPAKVKQAMAFTGNDRSILVSSDGHVLDGHHQWLAKAQKDEPVKITRLNAPIAELLTAIKAFPSAGMTKDAAPAPASENNTSNQPVAPADIAQAATESIANKAAAAPVPRKLVTPPLGIVAAPATPENPGTAQYRKRRAELQHMAGKGFNRVEVNAGVSTLVNPVLNQAVTLGSAVDVNLAQQAVASAQRARDTAALGAKNDASTAAANQPLVNAGENQGAGGAIEGADQALAGATPRGVRNAEFDGRVQNAGAQRSLEDDASFVAELQQEEQARYQTNSPGGTQSPSIRLADPKSQKAKAVNQMLDILYAFTGQRGIAVDWSGESSADGAAWKGRFVVDVNKPSMSIGHTLAHEFKHLSESYPELQQAFDRLFDVIPEDVKKNYASKLLKMKAMTPAEASKLRLEITADFMGEMLTDKPWLTDLAMRKPALFGAFIHQWINALDGLIGKLRELTGFGNKGAQKLVASRFKEYANSQATQAATAGLLADLEQAKKIAEEVMTLWAEKRPGYAKNSDVQYAKRAGPEQWRARDNFLVPEIDGIFSSDTGNIVTLPSISVTNKDGRVLTYPSMPVRISIGQHGVGAQDQFGVQHRFDNATEKRLSRGFITPDLGADGVAVVERAARDMAASVLQAAFVFPDKNYPDKVILWGDGQSVILQKTADKQGQSYWSVKTIIPQALDRVRLANGNPTTIKGSIIDGVEPQQFNVIKTRALSKLREPVLGLNSSESYTVSDDGLIVKQQTSVSPEVVVLSPKKVLQRDANGKIILNKNKVQRSDKDDFDYDVEAELQAEMEAELNGDPIEIEALDVSMAEIRAKGLMAEEAMPAVTWESAKGTRGSQLVAHIPSVHVAGKTERIEMNQQVDSGLWDLGLRGTWVGPAQGEGEGYASKKAVQAFAHRQVVARDLRVRGFDLAGSLPAPELKALVAGWKTLAQVDLADKPGQGPRRYATVTDDASSLKAIATSMGITDAFKVTVDREVYDPQNTAYVVRFTSKASGKEFGALLDQHYEAGVKFFTANTLGLGKGGLGAAFYQMASEFAARMNIPMFPESSLSGINTYRRTEQQLSAALRTGKSNVMTPHPTQRVYGFVDDAKTPEQHEANLGRLILATVRNARELVPGFDKLRYHPETGAFTDVKGKSQEAKLKKLLTTDDARAFGLGRSTLARAVLTQQLMDGVTQPDAVTSFAEPVLYSARDTAVLEYQEVDAKHRGTEGWMKAPNGQPSKLNERQWIQTRTPSFKKWFGDWEAGNIWGRDDVSKVVDDQGEPLVVYHGTDKGGFMSFDEPGGKIRGDLGIFTTSNEGMAASYVRKGRAKRIEEPEDGSNVGEWWNDEGGANEETPFSDLTPEQVAEATDRYRDEVTDFEAATPGVYAVFMNIRSPNEDNFEGALWNGSREHLWQVVVGGETQVDENGKQYFEEDDAREFAKQFANPLYEDDDGSDYLTPADDHFATTDGVVREARKDGNDGAIIREVVDSGSGYSSYNNEPSDVFVALKPSQLKSADWNTGEFGGVDDLRHSKRDTVQPGPSRARGIIGEVAPHPDKDAAKGWREMSLNERDQANRVVTRKMLERVYDLLGLKGWSYTLSSGSWAGEVNPNFIIEAPPSASMAQIEEVGRVIGFILDQQAMVVFDENDTTDGNQAGFVRVQLPRSMPNGKMAELRAWIGGQVPQAESDTLRDGSFVIGNFSAFNDNIQTLSDEDFDAEIVKAVAAFEWDGEKINITPVAQFRSDLIWPDNKNAYLEGTRYGRDNTQPAQARGVDIRVKQGRDVLKLRKLAAEITGLRRQYIGARESARRVANEGSKEREPTANEHGGGGPGNRSRPLDAATIRAAVHYGTQSGLKALSGRSNGTGINGAEDERVKQSSDPRIKQRVYFYSPIGGGMPQPELGLGGNVYQADVDGLYDPRTVSRPINGSGNAFESAVLDAGYDGYVDPESGVIVVLGRDVPVKHIGAISDFKLVQRVATRFVPKNATRTEGNELVRKPEGAEMVQLAHPARQAKIGESAPSFKMEYGALRVKASEAASADQAIAEFSPTFRFGEIQASARDEAGTQDGILSPEIPLLSKQNVDALAVEQEAQKLGKYHGKKVSVPVKIEDTGEVATLIMQVDKTAADYVARLKTLEDLVACL